MKWRLAIVVLLTTLAIISLSSKAIAFKSESDAYGNWVDAQEKLPPVVEEKKPFEKSEPPMVKGKPMVRAAKPVFCGDSGALLKSLTETHGESPILIFSEGYENVKPDESSQIIVFVNLKKRTASIVENMPSGYACMLGNGVDIMMIPAKKGKGV